MTVGFPQGPLRPSATVCRTEPEVGDCSPATGGRGSPDDDGRTLVTAASGDAYHIERVYLDRDQAYGVRPGLQRYCAVEPVQVEEWQTGAPPGAYDCPYWRARVPVSKRGGELRHTPRR